MTIPSTLRWDPSFSLYTSQPQSTSSLARLFAHSTKKQTNNMDLSARSHSTRQPRGSNTMNNDQAAAAAASLQLLLREDPLLVQYGLTKTSSTSSSSSSTTTATASAASSTDEVAFPYAAALLRQDVYDDNNSSSSSSRTTSTTRTTDAAVAKQRADMALQDVERKLALVESLAVKLSRNSPEAVAGPLLRLHGYHVVGGNGGGDDDDDDDDDMKKDETEKQQQQDTIDSSTAAATSATTTTTATLTTIRDRADRLERQAESVQAVARRVEGSLTRSLTRMQTACTRLERVLQLQHALKTCMRWQFEFSKLQSADLEGDNVRDLTAAAASVAVLLQEENDNDNAVTGGGGGGAVVDGIHVLDELRPAAASMAATVRQAAANLLLQSSSTSSSSSSSNNGASLSQLGATLQVYYHLGELPEAVWKAVQDAHQQALAASRQLWNPVTLLNITEQAKRQQLPKDSTSSIGSSSGGGGGSSQRVMQKKLKLARADAAQQWAAGMEQAIKQVRNLEQVLRRKTDPIKRQIYMDVVAAAPIPTEFASTTTKQNKLSSKSSSQFSLFQLFWGHLCESLAEAIESVLKYENGKLRLDVAALYPAVRASSLELMGRLQEASSAVHAVTLSSSVASGGLDEATMNASSSSIGILGGSSALEDPFLQWTTGDPSTKDNPQAATSADSWTRPQGESGATPTTRKTALGAMALRNAVMSSQDWLDLQGTPKNHNGLYPLEQAFLTSCRERLQEPLQYMFPGHDTMLDEDGAVIGTTNALLPSKYDLQRFDENIRQELSLADPREGGGDLSAVVMIAECVVDMLSDFCVCAKNALSGVGSEQGYTVDDAWNMTENLQHDRKVVAILYTLKGYLRQAPEKTFVAPYRPTTLPHNEEAAHLCQVALMPAIDMIDRTSKFAVLNPVCRSLNRKIASVLAKMHLGVYLEENYSGDDEASPAFVQKHLVPVFDLISKNFTSKFPPPYAAIITSTVATYTLYSFVSNASLVRPLGESARLHITQDLADLELMLDQFVGGTLHQTEGGRPYAELRAVRQMLFWSGLESKTTPATEVAKSLLREGWIKDVRPSTVFQYLFSFAPNLLSSPHHAKRLRAEDYVSSCLVLLDGSVESGEDDSWMTTMACCDAYQQRAAASRVTDGDPRIAEILMALGQELLRRRRR